MAWSWLGFFFGFLLFPLVFTIAYFRGIGRETVKIKVLGAFVIAGAITSALTAVLFTFYVAPQWAKGVRLIWTDMRTDNSPLVIGGSPDEAIVGWPTSTAEANGTGPNLTADPTQGNEARVTISGGDGFVYDEGAGRVLNGTPVSVGQTARFGKYSIRVNHLGWAITHPFTNQLEVLDSSGNSVAGFNLANDRTRSMRYLLPATLKASLFTKERAGERDEIDDWAGGLWLLRIDTEKVYVLEQNSKSEARFSMPNSLSLVIRWPNLSLPVTLTLERQRAILSFKSPWRFSAPLPPKAIEGCGDSKRDNNLTLFLTSDPRPCEIALMLPFGAKQDALRQEMTIDAVSRQFTSAGAINNEQPANCPPGAKCEQSPIGLSQFAVRQGNHTFGLAVVEDMPNLAWCAGLLLIGLLLLAWGLWLTSERFPRTNLWLVYGMVLVIWNFLVFRLMLSFRYALDPSALDALAVSGVSRAFFGLMVTPGLLLLVSRIRCDHYEKPAELKLASRAFRRAWLYFVGICLAVPASLLLPSRVVWSRLPDSYHGFTFTLSAQNLIYLTVWIMFFLLISAYLIKLYGSVESEFISPWKNWRARTADDQARAGEETKILSLVQPLALLAWRSLVVSLLLFSPWRWAEQSYFESVKRDSFWRSTLSTWTGFGRYLLLFVVRLAVFLFICLVARKAFPGDKLVQELAVPILFYWLALDWIGLGLALRTSQDVRAFRWEWLRLALLAIATISVPAVVLPVVMFDFGSILPVLAIVFPLAAILLLTGRRRFSLLRSTFSQKLQLVRDRRVGIAVVIAIVALFGAGYFFYENLTGFLNVPIVSNQGRVFARLLNFKYGSQAQRWALTANSFAGGEGVPFQELLNGNQHAWENKAIAHFGGWTGEGFGKAPTRLSQVRQDTLQYDSAFSFFVVSEYGFLGGCFLLIMYSLPLLLVLTGAREHFDGGYALAVIVASSFLIEGLYHAGMNWGVFPITGRNLPLLSVNSPSDLFKWTVLLGFLVQSIFWRYQGSGRISAQAQSLLPPAYGTDPEEDSSDIVRLRGWQLASAVFLILLFPAVTFLSVVRSGFTDCRDVANELETFSYKPLLDDAKWYLENGYVEYIEDPVGSGRKLMAHEDKLNDPDAKDFILQEVYRFNARNIESQIEAANKGQLEMLKTGLNKVHDFDDYNRFLEGLRSIRISTTRPSLFRLRPERNEAGLIVDYKVQVNDDFNVRFRFRHQNDPRDIPRLSYGDVKLLGPSWINGRYSTVITPPEDLVRDKTRAALTELPWIENLARAMESEWDRLGRDAAAQTYPRLTLDPLLQEASGSFIANRGADLHQKLLTRPTRDFADKLPPRVAISVISLPDGKVWALSGWPRMTSGQTSWQKVDLQIGGKVSAWVPSAFWLDKEAPLAVKRRYEGDRNFERTLVMGSITKPIWASAVMKIHPSLARLLKVMPAGDEEDEVFGLRVPGSTWNLNSHSRDWVGFDEFLRYSDNRYQVRTGWLGLAEKDGDGFKASSYGGSPVESLNGKNQSWGKEPQFTSAVVIDRNGSKGTISRLNLAHTELGKSLHDLYSIGTDEQKGWTGRQTRAFFYRRSFWTLNEKDDDSRFESKPSWLLDLISPQAPDFYFDQVHDPRYFINMLLGGMDNRWANVDLASAFGSCITGHAVIAHIIDGATNVAPLDERAALDPQIARTIRVGLNQAVEEPGGTAHALIAGNELDFLKGKVKLYAKTGTLKPDQDANETSRIALALIKWKDEKMGVVADGLVFTVVAEEGKQGTATLWLKEFLIQNKSEIAKLLKL